MSRVVGDVKEALKDLGAAVDSLLTKQRLGDLERRPLRAVSRRMSRICAPRAHAAARRELRQEADPSR